jgi:NADH dehydrogenase
VSEFDDRRIAGRPTETFVYRDKGSMATIGRSRAVAEIGKVRLSGFLAWLTWLLVHIYYLVDFRSRPSSSSTGHGPI